MKAGALFAGYGGLELGVAMTLPLEVAWHCEVDESASRVLAHRFPGVPNHGDVTRVDWSAVEPVEVLLGGFPCQDVSSAGRQAGLREGTRSGLWIEFARAIATIRPRLVVIENVRNLTGASAHSEVEWCPQCMGAEEEPRMRALGAVLGDLADLGYDARWRGVRASDVGASHQRERVFILAWPARDAEGTRLEGPDLGRLLHRRPARLAGAAADSEVQRRSARQQPVGAAAEHAGAGGDRRPAADTDGGGAGELARADLLGRRPGATEQAGLGGGGAVAADSPSERRGEGQPAAGPEGVEGAGVGGVPSTTDAGGDRREGRAERDGESQSRLEGAGESWDDADGRGGAEVDWGIYTEAVRQAELIAGRPAPSPTELNRLGNAQLAPRFVEWMMLLPDGWVTEPAIWEGMTPAAARREQIRILGNGVVPAQAGKAVDLLLESEEEVHLRDALARAVGKSTRRAARPSTRRRSGSGR